MNDFIYSSWSACQIDNTQSRTVSLSFPSGCAGGNPILSRSCIYVPDSAPTCISFAYSTWGNCQIDSRQHRTIISSSPAECDGGNPILSRSCAYIPPTTDITSPAQPNNFQFSSIDEQITLSWNNPDDTDFIRVLIIRKQGSAPVSRTDGINVYEGNLETYTDTELSDNKIYYYAIYSYDNVPNYSESVVVSAKLQAVEPALETESALSAEDLADGGAEEGAEPEPEPIEPKSISEMTIVEIKAKIVEIQLTIIQLIKQLIELLSRQISYN